MTSYGPAVVLAVSAAILAMSALFVFGDDGPVVVALVGAALTAGLAATEALEVWLRRRTLRSVGPPRQDGTER